MTLTIDLPEMEAQRLSAKANKAGKTLKGYVKEIAVNEANKPDGEEATADGNSLAEAIRKAVSPDDKVAHLMRWLDSHDQRAPALPPAAVSREAVYGEDENRTMSRYLIDANQFVYSINPASPEKIAVAEAFRLLIVGSHPAFIVPQVLTEFWVIATKPIDLVHPEYSGLGLTPAEAKTEIDVFRSTFGFLPDSPAVFDEWLRIVQIHETKGKKAHDARLVAFMWVYGIDRILTNNAKDFQRYPRIQAVTPHELPDLLQAEAAA